MIPESLLRAFTAPLFPLGEQSISLLWLLQVVSLLVAVSLVARGIKFLLKDRLLPRFQIHEGRREAIATLTSLGVAALGYVLVVQGMGLDFGALAVILGALGVGLGFGLQDLTRNLSGGLTLLMEGKLKVGDLIEFNQTTGFIKQISIRSTVISTFQGSETIVPNSFLTNIPVQNLSYSNFTGRIDVPVMVAHDSDVLEVTEVLLHAALDEPHVNAEPAPYVIFTTQGEAGLGFTLSVWTSNIQTSQTIRSGLNYAIQQGFRERDIHLAWPRREIRHSGVVPAMVTASAEQSSDAGEMVDPVETLSDLLKDLRFFKGLKGRSLRQLIISGARRHLSAGEILVHQGEMGQSFNIVLSGSIDAIHETDRVSQRLFSFKSGEFFGELPLLLDVPYPTTMRAAENTTLFVIPRGGFRPLLQLHPAFAEIIAEELSRRKDVLHSYEDYLRERGLYADEAISSPFDWIRDRLKQFLR
jgi:small-conductance mechanosensitive channel